MISPTVRRLARRAYYRSKRYGFYRIRDLLEQSQYFSRAELHAMQDEKLRALIRHAYETVPFYRDRMAGQGLVPEDVRGAADLPKLPVLTRADIRDHREALISRTAGIGRPIWGDTGGSTGEPLRTANDLRGIAWNAAAYQRGLAWAGYDLDRDRLAILFGGSLKAQGRGFRRRGPGLQLSLPAYGIRSEVIGEYYDALRQFQPFFLKGYAGAVYLLARGFADAGYPPLAVGAIFTTSEHLPMYQRRAIEEVFRTKVFDYYGSVEINSIGYECEHHNGYHIPEEHVIVEAADGPLAGVSDADGGALIVTDLDNYLMPLIRYRNGDAGILDDAGCGCGRSLTRIARLHGRVSDLLRSTDGNLVDGGVVDYIMARTERIREFCLIQEHPDLCRLMYVADGSADEIPWVLDQLRTFLGTAMRIEAESVAAIPLTPSGKRRFTISRIDGENPYGSG